MSCTICPMEVKSTCVDFSCNVSRTRYLEDTFAREEFIDNFEAHWNLYSMKTAIFCLHL